VKLSEPMRRLLLASAPGVTVDRGPIRAALMRRGLVHNMHAKPGDAARLTDLGRQVRASIITERGES
jgi:hypothetical protein